jgi:hypothetical protein
MRLDKGRTIDEHIPLRWSGRSQWAQIKERMIEESCGTVAAKPLVAL